jgi:hypothetical protein
MGKLADLLSGEGTLTDVVLEGRALFSVGQVGRLMGDADGGRWAVDGGRWTVDSGRWTVGGGRWTVDGGRWTVDGGGSRAETEHRNVRPLWEHPARERLLRLERELERGTFVSHAEMMTYMHDTLLRDTDQMSMAHGLEVRVPFLDTVFAEGVLGLGDAVKFGGRWTVDGGR